MTGDADEVREKGLDPVAPEERDKEPTRPDIRVVKLQFPRRDRPHLAQPGAKALAITALMPSPAPCVRASSSADPMENPGEKSGSETDFNLGRIIDSRSEIGL